MTDTTSNTVETSRRTFIAGAGSLVIGQIQPVGDTVVADRVGREALDQLADGIGHRRIRCAPDPPRSRRARAGAFLNGSIGG